MLTKWIIAITWTGILVLALFLRMDDLGERPVHADEATGARILAQQLEGAAYAYNPKHFHGPVLSQVAYLLARLRSEHDWSGISITTLRASTVLGGFLLVLTPLLWRGFIGPLGALIAAACLATSPLLVYYSRTYIHETWLALFGMLACAGLFHLALRPTPAKALATGVAIGLMFATKITVAISLFSWALALFGLFLVFRRTDSTRSVSPFRAAPSVYLKCLGYLAIGAFCTAFFLYSNYLQNPAGILDALQSFFIYEPTVGHEKPFFYYAERLLWPKQIAGIWWTEALLLLFAVTALCIPGDSQLRAPAIFLVIASLAHGLVYASISYKTPWLMLLPWSQVCLLAGCLGTRLSATGRPVRLVIALIVLAGLGHQTRQALDATGRLENNPRNPYAYVPTSQDAAALASWLAELNTLQQLEPIAVVGREYWPLPWYLRGLDAKIDYWPDQLPEEMSDYPLILAMPERLNAVRDHMAATHAEYPRTLRKNVALFVFLEKGLLENWTKSDDRTESP